MSANKHITLDKVPEGKMVKIVRINAGHSLNMRIKSLGLLEGDEIKVLKNTRGPVIVGKGGLRLALGRGMSHKIVVEYLEN